MGPLKIFRHGATETQVKKMLPKNRWKLIMLNGYILIMIPTLFEYLLIHKKIQIDLGHLLKFVKFAKFAHFSLVLPPKIGKKS